MLYIIETDHIVIKHLNLSLADTLLSSLIYFYLIYKSLIRSESNYSIVPPL